MIVAPQPTEHLSQHFTRGEFLCKHCGAHGIKQELIDALEALRRMVQRPIVVTSGYRCPKHPVEKSKSKPGYHAQGLAADITVSGMTPRQVYAYALHIAAFHGFGVDDNKKYLHVDVRPGPQIARWTYDVNGKVQPWQIGG